MKSFKHYILVIAISLLPFISIFASPLAPHTHDSPVHYARMAAYVKALSEGQILPRWAGELNYGYGMPLFNFIYHVPYLVTSLVISLGGGLVFSFKAALFISFLLSGIFMYMFSLRFLKNEGKAFIATVLYQFAPFHLVDLVVRGDMAEGFAVAFLPLILYALMCGFSEKNAKKSILFTGIAGALLILSHNAISLLFFGIALLFALLYAPSLQKRLESAIALGLALCLSAFYWLPALIERKYTYGDLFMKDMYLSHFAPTLNFFLPNFTNSEHLQIGGIDVSLGFTQVIVLVTVLFLLARKKIREKEEKKTITFGLFLTFAALFFMQPVSAYFWSTIPILRMFQFPWRFLNITVFSLALLGGVAFTGKKTHTWVLVLITVVTVLSSAVFFRPPLGMDHIDETYYWNYPLNTTYFGETDVIWSAGPAGSYPQQRFEVIEGNGTISNQVKKGTMHTFTVDAQSDVNIVDKTQYFPGWRVLNGGQKIPIEFQDQNWRGLITFRLPPGTHHIQVLWGKSPIRRIADAVTALSFITIGGIMLINRRKI